MAAILHDIGFKCVVWWPINDFNVIRCRAREVLVSLKNTSRGSVKKISHAQKLFIINTVLHCKVPRKKEKKNSIKQHLYGYLPPTSKTIQGEQILDMVGEGQSHKWYSHTQWLTNISQLAKTYIHQLCIDTGCCLEDRPRAMVSWNGWQESSESMPSTHFYDDDDFGCVFTQPFYHKEEECNTGSIFEQNLTGLNLVFFFSRLVVLSR